jgi:hypothetical protein
VRELIEGDEEKEDELNTSFTTLPSWIKGLGELYLEKDHHPLENL